MSSKEAPTPNTRKRQLSAGAELSAESSTPSVKRQKLEHQQRHETPPWFWDNLSRLWLTRRCLREFDRRTVWPAFPVPPDLTGKANIQLAQLKRFARRGGPSLGDLRAYPEPDTMSSSNRASDSSQPRSRKRTKSGEETDISAKVRKSSAYDPGFEQHLIDHGIYPEGYDDGDDPEEPANWEEIKNRLAQPRPSLSPTRFPREEFQNFKRKHREALTEGAVMSTVFPIIAGSARIPHSENLYFGNLKPLTNKSITKAQPDFYDGSRPTELDKEVRKNLGSCIVPSTNTTAPCLPNFFTEGKGPSGNFTVCKRQALYDGALGARGIHELRRYVDPETIYDNNAYTIPSTYHDGILRLYTIHPTPSTKPNIPTEYRMTKLRGWDLTDDPDTFRKGASALRNARDWTKEKREELVAAANRKAQDPDQSGLRSSTQSFVSLASKEPTHSESETSADELAADTITFVSPHHRNRDCARFKPPPKASSAPRVQKPPVKEKTSNTMKKAKNGT